MNTLITILWVISIIGILFACGCGDAADGNCGIPGPDWMNDKAQEEDWKYAELVGIPSFIAFITINIFHKYFGVLLFGCF